MVKEGQKQGQRREPLLPIDDEFLAVLVADDDRPEKIVSVLRDGAALVAFLVALKELVSKIVDEFGDLLLLPLIFPLIVVDRILVASKELGWGDPYRRWHAKVEEMLS